MMDLETAKLEAVKRAVEAAGGARRVAEECEITPEAVYMWKQCPSDRIGVIERLSGVPRHELRPDIFDPPEKKGRRGG
jgi:DNA-binding transcriptional regulator YdaS (Cro superfamily)